MSTKITEKTNIEIEDMNNIELYAKPHIDKIFKVLKFFNSKYVKITSHIEQMDDGRTQVLMRAQVRKKK